MVVGVAVAFLARVGRLSPQEPARPVVLASGDWSPYVGPDLADGGPVTAIVVDVLRRQGYEPEVSYSSWPVALDRTARSEVLAGFPFIADEQRRDDYLVSDPILEFDYVLFYSTAGGADPPEVNGPDDLGRLRVALIDGYAVWPELDDAVDEFVVYDTSEDAFAALAAGEVDLVPEGRLSGEAVASSGDLALDRTSVAVLDAGGDPLLAATEELHLLAPRTDEGRSFLASFDATLALEQGTELYRRALASIRDGGQVEVELAPVGDRRLVQLWSDADGGRPTLAPQGSRALVLDWPDEFEGTVAPGTTASRARVKVLNGPARGRVLWVDADAIRLVAGSSG